MTAAASNIIDRSATDRYLARLGRDHRFFVRELWKDRKLDQKAPLGDIEYEMLDWMFTGPRMRGVLGVRGMGKSTLLVATLIVYRGYRDGDRKIFVISKSATEAKNTIGLTRDWLDHVWFLRHMAPQKGQPDNTNFYDFRTRTRGDVKQESVKAIGNDGQIESNRAHSFLMDDVETKNNTRTPEAREELVRTVANEATNVVYAVDNAIDPNELIDIGTFKCEDSFHKKLQVRGYRFVTYPIAYPQKDDEFLGLSPIIAKRLADGTAHYTVEGRYDDNPVFPHFFSKEIIKERMGAGMLDFGMENMLVLNPGSQTRPPLRLSDLIVMPLHRDDAPIRVHHGGDRIGDIACEGLVGDGLFGPKWTDTIRAPYQTTIAVIDIAGEGNDLMGVAIVGYLNGLYFPKHCRGYPGGASAEQMAMLAKLLRTHGARTCWVETNIDIFGTFVPALDIACRNLRLNPGMDPSIPQGWSCSIDGFHATGMKEQRICSTLSPIIGGNKMIVDPSCLKPDIGIEANQTLQYQISRIRPIRRWLSEDGPIDALASCVSKLQEGTAGNRVDPTLNRHQQETLRIKALLNQVRAKQGKPRELVQTIDLG